MEFQDRKRTNNNRRRIEIVSEEGNIIIADITDVEDNVTQQGTAITAEVMNEIYSMAVAAKNVANKVETVQYDSSNQLMTIGASKVEFTGNIYLS